MGANQQSVGNLLLRGLSVADFALLAPQLSSVRLARQERLVGPEIPITRSWFLETGAASIIAGTADGAQTEIAQIGREGLVDVATVLGGHRTPLEVMVQAEGEALAISSAALREAMADSLSLRDHLLDYAANFIVQISYSVLAAASFSLRARLARWLLMWHDRVEGDEIAITHEIASLMLNVRRSGVTEAIQALEAEGAIEARRGAVRIVNRSILCAIAGEAYGQPEANYAATFG